MTSMSVNDWQRILSMHLGGGVDEGEGMDACLLGLALLIEGEEASDGLVGVGHAHKGGAYGLGGLEGVVDEHDGGFGVVDVLLISGVGEESNGARHALLYLGEGADGCIFIAFDGAVQIVGNLACGKIHVVVY